MTAKISVITPYLNAGAYLAEAIASVEEQGFGDWELILVDDGSTDGSRTIADAAEQRDPRIRSLERPSEMTRGAAAARNWGIRQSTGEFLVFLDADDRLLPGKLSTELGVMGRYPDVGMSCGGTVWWYPGEERRNWSDEVRSLSSGVYEGSMLLNRAILLQRVHVPCLCAVMVRRRDLPPGPSFEERFALYEDQTLLVKMMLNAPIYLGRHLTALYRQHGASTSALAEQSGEYQRHAPHRARGEFLRWVRAYVQATGKDEPSISEALVIADSVQSGDRSALTPSQRATMLGFHLADQVKRLTRPLRQLLRRALKIRSAPS